MRLPQFDPCGGTSSAGFNIRFPRLCPTKTFLLIVHGASEDCLNKIGDGFLNLLRLYGGREHSCAR